MTLPKTTANRHELLLRTGNLRPLIPALMLVIAHSAASQPGDSTAVTERAYDVEYNVRPVASRGGAFVTLKISQKRRLLRALSIPSRANNISELEGDGSITHDDRWIRWEPPADGGQLRWFAAINHLRDNGGYDAYITDDWAVFRAEDIIPPALTRTVKGAVSNTRLSFNLPRGWSAVTQYFRRSGVFRVSNPHRRFDTPTGWVVLGKLGTRYETISGVRVIVAAPVGHDARRMDILAMLRWTLPDVARLLPNYPKRLTIVSAGDPMWRGGLSAPASFYVHASRPLISENATSTLMHEVMHIGLGIGAVAGADWIIEGLAEYYSLEILRRSGTISEKRYRSANAALDAWGKEAGSLCAHPSGGAVTARAVTLMSRLNDEIRSRSDNKLDLDDVIRHIAQSKERVSVAGLRAVVEDLTGKASAVLGNGALEACERNASAPR